MTKPLALTEEEVLAIREQYDNRHITQGQLAEDYGVSVATINYAINGKGSYAKFTNGRVETEAKEADMTIDKGWLEAWQKSVEDELVKMRKRVEQATKKPDDTWRYCDRLAAVFMDVEARLNKLESSNTPADPEPEPSPCPWCGNPASVRAVAGKSDWELGKHQMTCTYCKAAGPMADTPADAEDAWEWMTEGARRHADDE